MAEKQKTKDVKVLLNDRWLGHRSGDLILVDKDRAKRIVDAGGGEYVTDLDAIEVAPEFHPAGHARQEVTGGTDGGSSLGDPPSGE